MDHYTLMGVRFFVPFVGMTAGLIGAIVFRRLSWAMLLVITGFGALTADFVFDFGAQFFGPTHGPSPADGVDSMRVRYILSLLGWGSLITGLIIVWKDFANHLCRAKIGCEELALAKVEFLAPTTSDRDAS